MNPSLDQINNRPICLVHDWLVTMRGGEKVLEAISELFPNAPIYTLFAKKENLSPVLQKREIRTSFLQWIPGIVYFYRWLLVLFPIAIRTLDLKQYDLVISSSHCVAKGVHVNDGAVHICYCHTPMRYLWGFEEEYLGRFPKLFRFPINLYFNWLRKWDVQVSKRVDCFVANSKNTAGKILSLYGKEAVVINPPVDSTVNSTKVGRQPADPYYLIVSALVPYKRIDLAIEAFNKLKRPLKIVGNGPMRRALQEKVSSEWIQFEGWLDQKAMLDLYANCRALIFPGEEDFGIAPVEAQMFGKPVIAYGKGGVTETVLAHNETGNKRLAKESTGLFFYEQTPTALIECVQELERLEFNSPFIQSHAERFNLKRFRDQFVDLFNRYPAMIHAAKSFK